MNEAQRAVDPPSRSTEGSPIPLIGATILALVLAIYAPALSAGFVYDDVYLIEQQTCFRGLAKIPSFFVAPYDACDYRPMRYVTYAFDHAIAGTAPWIYHLTNVVLHALSAVMVWALLLRLGGFERIEDRHRRSLLALGAVIVGLWALHPALADAVVPAAGRRDVQSTFLFLLALWAWLRRDEGRRALWLGLCGAAWVAALMTKEMAITLPAILVLVEALKPGSGDPLPRLRALLKKGWPLLGIFGAMALSYGIYRGFIATHTRMSGRWWGGTIWTNLLNTLALQVEYARLTLWPASLLGDYAPHSVPVVRDPFHGRVLVGAAIWGALLASVPLTFKRRPLVALGLSWYLVTLLPVCHLIPHHELMAEHFLHLPMVGLALALYGALEPAAKAPGMPRKALAVALGLASSAVMARLQWRIPDFTSDETFGMNILEQAPRNVRNLGRLAAFYLDEDHLDLERAERLAWMQRGASPPGTIYHRAATLRLARILERHRGDPERAASLLALTIQETGDDAELTLTLARLYLRHELPDDALPLLDDLIGRDPLHWEPRLDSGFARLMKGDADGAGQRALEVVKLAPAEAEGHFLMGNVRAAQGQPREAFLAYENALANKPDHVGALMATADILCALGQQAEAAARASRAKRVDPGSEAVRRVVTAIEAGCP